MDAKSKSLLLYLSEATDKQLSSFLKIADKGQILVLKETVFNLLLGNLPITEEDKKALKKYKNFLREFARKGSKSDIKRKAKVIKLVLRAAAPVLKRL